MSDNPEDTSIYNLLINSDPETVQALSDQLRELTAQGMSLADAFEQINASAAKVSDGLDAMTGGAAEGIAETSSAVQGLNQQLQDTQTQTERVNELLAQMREQAAEAASAIPEPPAFPGLEEEGGGGTGSLFGVGHAFSVAGHAMGSPALREAGGLIYIEEGLKRIAPLAEQFGEAVTNSSPGLTSLVAGVTGLDAPMAGLLAIAGPLAIAVGGLVIGLKLYNDTIAESSRQLSGIIKGQDEYYKFIEKATTEEAKQKVTSLEDTNVTTKKKLDENVDIVRKYLESTGVNVLGEGAEFLKNVKQTGAIGAFDPQVIKDAFDAAQKYSDEIDKNDDFIGRLTGDIKNNSLAANDAAEATKKATEAAIAKANNDAALGRQLIADSQMSVDSAKKRLDTLQQEGPVIQAQMEALKPYIATNEEARKKYEELDKQLQNDIAEVQYLTLTAIPAAQAAKDLADNLKLADEALKGAEKAHETYLKAVESAEQQLAFQKQDAATKEAQKEAELSQGSIQDTYERSKIVLEESRKETQIVQDTANTIADIRTKLSQKETADLTAYNRQLMDDQTKYQEEVQKDQTKAYRTERDNYEAHVQKLADIQSKTATDQQDALLNRNFLALAKVQESKQIDAEDTAYARKQAAAQQRLQDELSDLATHEAELRAQQYVAYQRKLVDERLHAEQEIEDKNVLENRKIEALRTHEQQQLIDLTTTEQYKIAILRQGFAAELALYETQEQRRIQLAQQAEQQFWQTSFQNNPVGTAAAATGQVLGNAASQVGGFINMLFGNQQRRTYDQGGTFNAGEAFFKGDIAEMFNFGGAGSYSIPGAAMVMPLQSGTAQPMTGGGHTFNIPVQINASTKEEAARQAADEVYKRIMETFTN